ncbi:MAG: hypothetical protein Q3971_02150 [Moraxella sp.]|nr:hypothetical protein [Moraxella sp.]
MSFLTPVKYPVKYYSWQDDNAPALSATDGAIKTILKACLITGYGDKDGAGWQMLFEEDNRMMIKPPKHISHAPYLRISNGVSNGQARYSVASYTQHPTSLDDPNIVTERYLYSKDARHGNRWHLLATDFAFIFCYEMGANFALNRDNPTYAIKNTTLFVGGLWRADEANRHHFYMNSNNYANNLAAVSYNNYPMMSGHSLLFNLSKNEIINVSQVINPQIANLHQGPELIGGQYIAMPLMVANIGRLPFYMSLNYGYIVASANQAQHPYNPDTTHVNIGGRAFFRWVDLPTHNAVFKALYAPLDYWEY